LGRMPSRWVSLRLSGSGSGGSQGLGVYPFLFELTVVEYRINPVHEGCLIPIKAKHRHSILILKFLELSQPICR
jgi:hypothetical protein